MIRYQEEEVELNDSGHFRVELEMGMGEQSDGKLDQLPEYTMEIELMFSDWINKVGPEKFQTTNSLKELDPHMEFRSVSSRKYSLRKMADGIFEYVPVVFEE